MSSVQSSFAQPKTRSFAVTQDQWGAYYFTQEAVDTWYAANITKINKIGDLYVIPGTDAGSTFEDVVEGNNGATELGGGGPTPRFDQRKTLTDMGKQIIIGNSYNSRLLVLRLVEGYASPVGPGPDATADGDGIVGYIVMENNSYQLGGNTGRFSLRVARV